MNTFVALSLLLTATGAAALTKCEVSSIFNDQGLNGYLGYELGHWVCIARFASEYDPSRALRRESQDNRPAISAFGIFQVNSHWCADPNFPGAARLCRVDCEDLVNDGADLRNNIACGAVAVRIHGMRAWHFWIHECDGNVQQYYEGCVLNKFGI
ncbi:lysozyme C-like [Chiloscyllium plagiosum]|uniref:lysozyme C-like n=1 Tax=Chiloscyllium plagiosum TaxID=36176 RepID=UPI001CB86B9C|nr:lysozyme C-like [Chiloscyllium plagiosum]XP_043557559.1 lysozyme C-like [Chiloscyllium plagiosum]